VVSRPIFNVDFHGAIGVQRNSTPGGVIKPIIVGDLDVIFHEVGAGHFECPGNV